MGKALFKVEKPGIYASIQDLGRFGYQKYGVPVSGAMDRHAHSLTNYILGNKEHFPSIEISFLGTEFMVLAEHVIAIGGADLSPHIDGEKAPMWKCFKVHRGQRLSFKKPLCGARAYVGVQGGIQCNPILGSCSTYERGGMFSRLEKGDVIFAPKVECKKELLGRGLSPKYIPSYTKEVVVRIVASHHESMFKEESVNAFYNQSYVFTKGDRMGYFLKGQEKLVHKNSADIVSEATTFGTVQVPSHGQPIVLLADSQTTGGYSTIGTVLAQDRWKIAQLPQGGKVNFVRGEIK
ncbi:5-oxoprolinase subunit C family protein [Evansella halocellulosilytica]|uniref:5-oxoprolinase subunit C family protein n=1 Tax=Evansella halocellulosilytica TaxID=2011013 RepID=UPI0015C8BF33|nr:biotin-dependent carboxyltransferase family protein [Evansella halocellulosilytica]